MATRFEVDSMSRTLLLPGCQVGKMVIFETFGVKLQELEALDRYLEIHRVTTHRSLP